VIQVQDRSGRVIGRDANVERRFEERTKNDELKTMVGRAEEMELMFAKMEAGMEEKAARQVVLCMVRAGDRHR